MVMCCDHLTLPYKGANSKGMSSKGMSSKGMSSKGISYESGKL